MLLLQKICENYNIRNTSEKTKTTAVKGMTPVRTNIFINNNYKTIVVTTLTYGSETWTTTTKDEIRRQSREKRYLRKLKGCIRLDRITKEL